MLPSSSYGSVQRGHDKNVAISGGRTEVVVGVNWEHSPCDDCERENVWELGREIERDCDWELVPLLCVGRSCIWEWAWFCEVGSAIDCEGVLWDCDEEGVESTWASGSGKTRRARKTIVSSLTNPLVGWTTSCRKSTI